MEPLTVKKRNPSVHISYQSIHLSVHYHPIQSHLIAKQSMNKVNVEGADASSWVVRGVRGGPVIWIS